MSRKQHQVPKPVADMFHALAWPSTENDFERRILTQAAKPLDRHLHARRHAEYHDRPVPASRWSRTLRGGVSALGAGLLSIVVFLGIAASPSGSPDAVEWERCVEAGLAQRPNYSDGRSVADNRYDHCVQVYLRVVAGADDDADLARLLRHVPGGDRRPTSPGPWPFAVVDTGEGGLFGYSITDANAKVVVSVANRSLVWADCSVKSDFTPIYPHVKNSVGPVWVRVRWISSLDVAQGGVSEPDKSMTVYMNRGNLVPVGHNGQLPTC